MKLKTFIYILAGFALFFVLSLLFYSNRAVLAGRFVVWGDRSVPVYTLLGLAFLGGLGLALAVILARESRHAVERWRETRLRREAQAADEMYSRGVEAMLDGRPGAALERLRAVLSRDPRRVDALLKAGEILRRVGRTDEAVELHSRAHKIVPEDPAPLYELVDDAEARDDPAAAKVHLSRIVELKPRAALSAYRRLRDIFIREQNWDRALEVQERVLRIRPQGSDEEQSDARTHLGIAYEIAARLLRTGSHKEAESQLRKFLKGAPGFVPAWRTLGEVHIGTRDDDAAVSTWIEGYEATKAPVLLTRLEDHFLRREQPERAIEIFRRAVASASPDTVPRFYLGKLFYRLEMLDEALGEFSALQDRASYTPTLAYFLAKIHERRGRFAEANACYRRIIRDGRYLSSQFRCLNCSRQSDAWLERCERCGEWNSVEVDFKEDVSLEELGISTAPVYSARRTS